ncbi:MAG TPA: helix-turn-helix domain-containing protein [Kiritimatiellia bacterium]|nr:helix-turn-helix domain-containing protein [Kiritimatiellia bacterium]
MKTDEKIRIESSGVDRASLDQLIKALNEPVHPALVNQYGMRTELPPEVFNILLRIVMFMREGRSIFLMPEDEAFTTQAAADFLGMSRQHLVTLLEKGELAHFNVGTHRRIAFKDLVAYDNERRNVRRRRLDDLNKKLGEAGIYDADEDDEDAG